MLQILFERGFIGAKLVTKPRMMRYSKDGKKDDINVETKILKEECKKYLLSHLLSSCPDVYNENTDLEQLCEEVSSISLNSAEIFCTPKFHYKKASEGIAYSWGASKRIYRCHPINEKISVADFEKFVEVSLSRVTISMLRQFSVKARGQMLIYKHKELVEVDTKLEWLFKKRKDAQKVLKSSRRKFYR